MGKTFSRKINDITFFYHDTDGEDAERCVTACSEDHDILREAADFFELEGWSVKFEEEESSTPEEPMWMLNGRRCLAEVLADEKKQREAREAAQKKAKTLSLSEELNNMNDVLGHKDSAPITPDVTLED